MKDVFYIHSALTEEIAIEVSKKKNKIESIYLEDERYNSKIKSSVSIENIYNFEKTKYNIFRRWKNILEGDKRISRMVEDSFNLHVPQTTIKEIRLLLSHWLCSGFSIMEEGLTSYCTQDEINSLIPPEEEPITRRVAYLGRLGKREFYRPSYDNVYAATNKSFPGYGNKTILDIEFGVDDDSKKIEKSSCILILESLKYESKKYSCSYIYALSRAVQYANNQYEKLHYKLHPDNYERWTERLFKNIIGRGMSPVEEIGRSTSIEDIAIGSGADVIVNLSATGLYCGLFSDGDVYSFFNILDSSISMEGKKGGGEFSDEFSWVPEIYWENVQPIEIQ
jgi:hypothetical protein